MEKKLSTLNQLSFYLLNDPEVANKPHATEFIYRKILTDFSNASNFKESDIRKRIQVRAGYENELIENDKYINGTSMGLLIQMIFRSLHENLDSGDRRAMTRSGYGKYVKDFEFEFREPVSKFLTVLRKKIFMNEIISYEQAELEVEAFIYEYKNEKTDNFDESFLKYYNNLYLKKEANRIFEDSIAKICNDEKETTDHIKFVKYHFSSLHEVIIDSLINTLSDKFPNNSFWSEIDNIITKTSINESISSEDIKEISKIRKEIRSNYPHG